MLVLKNFFNYIYLLIKYLNYHNIDSKMTGGPGPATYQYEKHSDPSKTSVPAFSIGRASRWPAYYIY